MAVAVVVEVSVKPGQIKAYVDYMKEMIALTNKEKGCSSYNLYEAADGSGGVVMVELWETQEDLDRHMGSDHFKKYIPGGDSFMDKPMDIRVFKGL